MKIFKVIFFSLLGLILIVCTGVFIFFETFDTYQYLPQITKKATLALGRPVSITGVGLGFSSRGITIDAGPLIIADDSGFTSQPFIKIDRVRINLDLKALILHREIHITHILLQSPQIHFIRSQEGNINAHSFGQVSQKNPVILSAAKDLKAHLDSSATPQNDVKAPHNDTIKALSAINIKSIKIKDIAISFIDQNQDFPKDIWLTETGANMNNISLELSKRSFQIGDLRLHADLSQLDIKDVSPQMTERPAIKNIRGQVQLNLAQMEIGDSGDLKASGELIITNAIIKNFNIIKSILSPMMRGVMGGMEGYFDKLGGEDTIIDKATAQFSIHDKTVFIDSFTIKTNIFEFTAKGSIDQGLNTDLQTMLHLNSDVSASLVGTLTGLKFLYDDTNRIAIGASLKGVIPHLKYKPDKDFRKKGKKALIEEGGNFLKNFLQ